MTRDTLDHFLDLGIETACELKAEGRSDSDSFHFAVQTAEEAMAEYGEEWLKDWGADWEDRIIAEAELDRAKIVDYSRYPAC